MNLLLVDPDRLSGHEGEVNRRFVFSANRGDDYLRDFFIPALQDAVSYKRVTGDFSSAFLSVAAQGLAPFFCEQGRMQLICNGRFSEEDFAAISRGVTMESVVESSLLRKIDEEKDQVAEFEKERLAILAELLSSGRLEIRVSYVIDAQGNPVPPRMLQGIQHTKLGVIEKSDGEKIGFLGSLNESGRGYEGNLETLVARYSSEPGHTPEIQEYEEIFQLLWDDKSPRSKVLKIPEACAQKLIEVFRKPAGQVHDGYEPAPSLVDWSHQDEAVKEFLKAKRGILEMATGTGKTRTALKIAATLFEAGEIESFIVATYGNDLLAQWSRELHQMLPSIKGLNRIYRNFESKHDIDHFLINPQGAALICSRESLPVVLRGLHDMKRVMLIHDEVHGLGSPGNVSALKGLSTSIPYRLGLSATPDREYDADGNAFIESEVGSVIYRFGLDKAIQRGVLCPFDLYPVAYTPTDADRRQVAQIQKEFHGRKVAGDPMSVEEFAQRISRVYKLSPAKLPVFDAFIAQHQDLLKRCIIFVETMEYGAEVLELVHKYRTDFHSYFADDDSENLHAFARGELECLVTCHKLSVGIDIQSVKSIILFASPRAKLETIQRIGRCLRRDPKDPKKRSAVVDFYRDDVPPEDLDNADNMRRTWLDGLSKIRQE